ncbi:LLM class flavin-dependent oxidoreductase [Nocardia colli]|uniref:LLM class flavin-dependent oxidoreductase n=1 Tax=Nocardia colli TaxID=2545717 RepID=A0A5N0E2Z2_9NOCA|nr:LLM class flavin-dependent oxidoreductase [Nocardia colli]KAA8882091.1 LLM class flavin-dependent oxidoreductase [Nocardia colli]
MSFASASAWLHANWVEKVRRAEALGYDVLSVPDHLGLIAPFPALSLAAEATERITLGTFVLNTPFFNPVLLARDVAALDRFSGGRIRTAPGVLIGTHQEIADRVRECRERYGITYFTLMEPDMDAFAPVIELLR